VPLALKIAPDMDGDQVKNIADALIRHKIDGVIATNTTLNRDAVTGMLHGAEAGGLSGAPVFQFSNTVIRLLKAELGDAHHRRRRHHARCGCRVKMDCGAQLVQLYSGLIYAGPALIKDCADAVRGH
jgi:dihydroorotate dehydrogenase